MAAASASSLLPPLSPRQTTKTPFPQRRPSNPCWVSLPSPSRAVSVAVSSQQAVAAPNELVDAIISKNVWLQVKGTDRGVLLTREGHAEVGGLAEELSKYCVEEPVKNPLIFGEWDVMYCSNPTSPGGGYRSAVGRLIFKTNEMVQAVEAPVSVRNRVSFSAFGFLDGEVSLKGKLKVLSDKWIQVIFEPPELKIGSFDFHLKIGSFDFQLKIESFDFQYGGESEVKLEITYVDEIIRAQFLLECLADWRKNLIKKGLNLLVQHGKPEDVLPTIAKAFGAHTVFAHKETCSEELPVEQLVHDRLQQVAVTLDGSPSQSMKPKLQIV